MRLRYDGGILVGTVYLIHFDKAIGDTSNPHGYAQHYLGYTDDLDTRLATHRHGNGARLMEVVSERGIGWQLVRTWEGDRNLERRLKNQKNAPRLCPVCRQSRGLCADQHRRTQEIGEHDVRE